MLALIAICCLNMGMSYMTFLILEAIHELRRCRIESPSGGYYQKWNVAYRLAARYLAGQCEIRFEKCNDGYSVYPYALQIPPPPSPLQVSKSLDATHKNRWSTDYWKPGEPTYEYYQAKKNK